MIAKVFCAAVLASCFATSNAQNATWPIPDSVRAVAYIATINVGKFSPKKPVEVGIGTAAVKLYLESEKGKRSVEFAYPKTATVLATGADAVIDDDGEIEWVYNWKNGVAYTLLLVAAPDSAGDFSLFSGYIQMPATNQWKLLGTCKIVGSSGWLGQLQQHTIAKRSAKLASTLSEQWVQRQAGSWKALGTSTTVPQLGALRNVDSLTQAATDAVILSQALADAGPVDSVDGVYFKIKNPGTGQPITVNDSVTVHYKGRLLNGDIFDQTRDSPSTFPLNRLIKGWQLALPRLGVGGSITIYIPSGQAYGIRTRSPKIPPNSVLVFDVDVMATRRFSRL